MQEVRPRPSAPFVAGSSSLQRGCLEAVPTPLEIPWLCVPPSPAVLPPERGYALRRGKNYPPFRDVHDANFLNTRHHCLTHFFQQNPGQTQAAREHPPPL